MNYQSQIPQAGQSTEYQSHIAQVKQLVASQNGAWDGINAESVARMRLQNRFQTGLDIARYTAAHHAHATWRPMTPIRPITPSRWAAGTASSPSRR